MIGVLTATISHAVHHVQHHVQPVLDTQHGAEQVQQKIVPQTHIKGES